MTCTVTVQYCTVTLEDYLVSILHKVTLEDKTLEDQSFATGGQSVDQIYGDPRKTQFITVISYGLNLW